MEKLTKRYRLQGSTEHWYARCVYALEKAGFRIVREDRMLNTLEARYRGFTIDGTLRVDVHEMGDRVELVILVTADENHWAAMFSDPCKRILDAFAGYLRD
jgi:hypothetical protein